MDICRANIRFIKSDFFEPTINVRRKVVAPVYRNNYFNDNIVIKDATPCERVYIKDMLGFAGRRPYNAIRTVTPRKPLLNSKGQFFVYVSRKTPHVQNLIDKAQRLGLTVSGDGTNRTTGDSIVHVEEGNYISFGSSPRFDVNWIRRDEYMCKKGYIPVYDIEDDWYTILRAVDEFANNKKKKTYYTTDGSKSTFHAGFAVVDGVVKKYGKDDVAVRMPVDTFEKVLDKGFRRLTIIW